MGTSPGPEREGSGIANREAPSSPSRAFPIDIEQDRQEQVTLATPPIDVTISTPQKDTSSASQIAPSSLWSQEMVSEYTKAHGVDTYGNSQASNFPPANGPRLDHQGQPSVLDRQADKTRPQDTAGDRETVRSSVPPFSQSSPSSPSSKTHSSPASSEYSEHGRQTGDNANGAFWSGSTSEFGTDGTVMSRLHQAPTVVPMASEIGRRWVEMKAVTSKSERAKLTTQASETKKSIAPHNDLAIQNANAHQMESSQAEVEAQRTSSDALLVVDHHSQAAEPTRKDALNTQADGEDTTVEYLVQDENAKKSSIHDAQSERLERTAGDQNVKLEGERKPDKRIDAEKLEISTAQAHTATNKGLDDSEDLSPAKIQDSVISPEGSAQASPASRVIVIDSASDDEEKRKQRAPIMAHDAPRFQVSDVTNQSSDLIHHTRGTVEHDNSLSKECVTREKKVSKTGESERDDDVGGHERSFLDSLQEDAPIHQENGLIMEEEPSVDILTLTETRHRPTDPKGSIAGGKINDDIVYPKLPTDMVFQDPVPETESLSPWLRFPSTSQDSLEDPSASQLMTPDGGRQMGLLPQPTPLPTLSSLDDQAMPTPSLLQDSSAGILVPEQKDPASFHTKAAQGQASQVVASQEQAEIHNIHDGRFTEEDTNELNKRDETEPHRIAAKIEPKQASLAELNKGTSAPKVMEEGKADSRVSSLITRVKELRRHSNQTPGKRLSKNSASPWFASRRSSQMTPNSEAESDVHVSPPEQVKTSVIKNPTKSAPEKADRRLSQSFIRSSPQQSPQPKARGSYGQELQTIPNSEQINGFRTSISYFVPLASLHCHYGNLVDVLAVAVSSTSITRAKAGPKDYTQTIYFIDPSSAESERSPSLTTAQIFRPKRQCFPEIKQGDAILLRDFKVQSFEKSLSLISTDSSAWAVFRKDTDVQMAGPPVEYGPEERAFARAHWDWWASLKSPQKDALMSAVTKTNSAGTKKVLIKKGLGFELLSSQPQKATAADLSRSIDETVSPTLRERSLASDGSVEPEGAKLEELAPQRRVLRPRNAKGKTSASPEKDAVPKVEEIHELRDGIKYVDREGLGPEEVEAQNGVHDLRDGTKYRD